MTFRHPKPQKCFLTLFCFWTAPSQFPGAESSGPLIKDKAKKKKDTDYANTSFNRTNPFASPWTPEIRPYTPWASKGLRLRTSVLHCPVIVPLLSVTAHCSVKLISCYIFFPPWIQHVISALLSQSTVFTDVSHTQSALSNISVRVPAGAMEYGDHSKIIFRKGRSEHLQTSNDDNP